MAAAIDGSAQGFATAATVSATLTTIEPNDWIVVFTYSHDVSTTSVTSSGVPGGFTLRKSIVGAATEWVGFAPTPLAAVNVTAHLSASGDASIVAVAVHGTFDSAKPLFDPNAGLPASNGPTTGTGCHIQISTTNTDDLLLYAAGAKGPLVNIVDPVGWTGLQNTGFVNSDLAVSYRIVGMPQTNLDVNPAVSDSHENTGIGDALNGLTFSGAAPGIVPRVPLVHW